VARIADSLLFVGARPVLAIAVCWSDFQLSFDMSTAPLPSCRSTVLSKERRSLAADDRHEKESDGSASIRRSETAATALPYGSEK
jgi:hypothetical protein